MMDTIKTYFMQVVVKNIAPKVSAAVISAGITFLIAHQEFMQQMGITYYSAFDGKWLGLPPTGKLIIVELDTLSVWGGLALVGLATGIWAWFQHHAVATVTGAPQDGSHQRATDPPAA